MNSNPLIGTPKIFFSVDILSSFYIFIGYLLAPRMHKHMHRHTIHDTHTTNTLHTQPRTHPSTHIHTGLDPLDLQLALVMFLLSTNAKVVTLVVIINCNVHWWCFPYANLPIYWCAQTCIYGCALQLHCWALVEAGCRTPVQLAQGEKP